MRREAELPRILVVDDEESIISQLKWGLKEEYECYSAKDTPSALEIFKEVRPRLVTLDMSLILNSRQGREGLFLLGKIKEIEPLVKVIMITGIEDKELALETINQGAHDYYVKPINIEELKVILRRALYIQKLEEENKRLTTSERSIEFEGMVGSSKVMRKIFEMVKNVALSQATVLIRGESGTGKELVARAIHSLSSRHNKPFVIINCGAIPEALLESELFGHERGAFTDAYTQRIGKLELANQGTVFLDEIGEMSLNLQVKILRFLQERIIERVGGSNPIELDVRVIAATNQNLEERMKEGSFREDLFYRLSVIKIELPPLREREGDILILARHFLNKYKKEARDKEIKGFSPQALKWLRNYSWPGNVREMENKVWRAILLSRGSFIQPQDLGFDKENLEEVPEGVSLKEARRILEERLIKKALRKAQGNISLTAHLLGISRPTLYDLLKKYNLPLSQEGDVLKFL